MSWDEILGNSAGGTVSFGSVACLGLFFKLLVSKGVAKPRSEDYFLHFCLFPYKSCLASVNALRSYLGVLPRSKEFPFCKLIAEIPDACHAKHQRAEPENEFKLHLIRRAGNLGRQSQCPQICHSLPIYSCS